MANGNPSNAALNAFAQDMSDTAMRAGLAYLKERGLTVEVDAFLACVRANIKARYDEAQAHAKEALDAHMEGAAIATFRATMALAGIDAAKEAGFPAKPGEPTVKFSVKGVEDDERTNQKASAGRQAVDAGRQGIRRGS